MKYEIVNVEPLNTNISFFKIFRIKRTKFGFRICFVARTKFFERLYHKNINQVFTIFLIPAEPRYNRGSAGIFKFSNAAPFFENVLSGKGKVFCKGEFFLDK